MANESKTDDILEVVGKHVRLERRGRHHVGLCPFHQERSPSLHVNQATGRFYCFGCHEHGTAKDFLSKLESARQPDEFIDPTAQN